MYERVCGVCVVRAGTFVVQRCEKERNHWGRKVVEYDTVYYCGLVAVRSIIFLSRWCKDVFCA